MYGYFTGADVSEGKRGFVRLGFTRTEIQMAYMESDDYMGSQRCIYII